MKYLRYLANYILSFVYDIYFAVWMDVRSRIQGLEYYKKSKLYPGYLKQGNMAIAAIDLSEKYCTGKGVDIGAGRWPIAGARAVEDNDSENAYHIKESNESLDFVFSSHSLEHLVEWQNALREWHRVLKPGANLVLYVPHRSCEMWEVGVNVQHVWAPTVKAIAAFVVTELHMTIVEQSMQPDGFLSFAIVAKK